MHLNPWSTVEAASGQAVPSNSPAVTQPCVARSFAQVLAVKRGAGVFPRP